LSKLARSTLSPFFLNSIEFKKNGEKVDRASFDKAHDDILSGGSWIIDGFGPIESFYKRLDMADTLIYIDLPYITSYCLVTVRLIKGLFTKPEGWPEGSSVLKGTLESYKVLRLCPKFWNDNFLARLDNISASKTLYIIYSISELNNFIDENVN